MMMRIGRTMPFDLESMLSSSPPGFELNLDIRSDFIREDEHSVARRNLQLATKARWYAFDRTGTEKLSPMKVSDVDSGQQQGTWLNEATSRRISDWESFYDCDQSILDSAMMEERTADGSSSRRVSFADDLESVLVIEELPDDPPWTLHSQGCVDGEWNSMGDVVLEEPLVLNFTQPAADYLTFRNAVEARYVSLANVILKNYRVTGTVRVKNIAYDKSVSVRHSLDAWKTYADTTAAYQHDDDERFDTFAFVVDCPPNHAPGASLQFAVRYTAGGVDYWDNNGGRNYEVLYVSGNSAVNYRQIQSPPVFAAGQSDDLWSEYSVWTGVDVAAPYW